MRPNRTGENSSSTAVGRLRRGVSAARSSSEAPVKDEESYASLGAADEEDSSSSVSLYKDASTVSAQRSRTSVLSGAHEQGDTFFTALKRQPSWQLEAASDLHSQQGGVSQACLHASASGISQPCVSSRSAFFSVDGGSSDDDGGGNGSVLEGGDDEEDGSRQGPSSVGGPSLESSFTTSALPQDGEPTAAADGTTDSSGDGCSGGQLTSSVLDIINSLYGASKPAAEAASGPAVDGDKSSDLPAGEASAAAALDAVGSVSQAAADGAGCDSVQQHAADDVDVQDSTQQACEEAESAAPEGDDDSPGSDPLADSSAAPPPTTTSNTALLAAIDGGLAERSRLQQELSGYLQQLGSRSDGEGAPLVVLADGGEYALLVERLLREGRAQHYRALDGWEGPHRFEDLPIAQLRSSSQSADPQVVAGLAAIAKLDDELREASLKALVSARALNPEQWADVEKRRLEKRAAELDAALAMERQRRSHAAQLRGALTRLDEQSSQASPLARGSASLSYYRLKPQEEELLAAVLSRDDAALEASNPFDPMLLVLDNDDADEDVMLRCGSHSSARRRGGGGGAGGGPSDQLMSAAALSGSSGCSANSSRRQTTAETSLSNDVGGSSDGVASRTGSYLSSTGSSVFSLMRPVSCLSLRQRQGDGSGAGRAGSLLADIDAQLDAIQEERQAAAEQCKGGRSGQQQQQGLSRSASSSASVARSSSGRNALSQQQSVGSSSSRAPSRIPSAPGTASPKPGSAPAAAAMAATTSAGAAVSEGRPSRIASASSASAQGGGGTATATRSLTSSSSGGGGGGSSSSRRISVASSGVVSGKRSSSSTVHALDYIREQREVKELAKREHELDVQLRALQTSELPSKLTPQQLQVLLQSVY